MTEILFTTEAPFVAGSDTKNFLLLDFLCASVPLW